DWAIHDLYGQALLASGENDAAIAEFKEARSMTPDNSKVELELGRAFEKKGDWVNALKEDRTAALTEGRAERGHQFGESYESSTDARDGYKEAKARLADHLRSLRASGKGAEAAELEKQIQEMDGSPDLSEKIELRIKAGEESFNAKHFEEAEKSFQEAV